MRRSTRRGCTPFAEQRRNAEAAIRWLDDPSTLRRSRLMKLTAVEELGPSKCRRHAFGSALCLCDLLWQAINRVLEAVNEREGYSLRRWADGDLIAAIAADMGLTRSHLSGHYRPQVVSVVTEESLHAMRQAASEAGSQGEHTEPYRVARLSQAPAAIRLPRERPLLLRFPTTRTPWSGEYACPEV